MTALALAAAFLSADDPRQFFELRVYRNDAADKQHAVLDYVADGLVPALNRAGVETVGVFEPIAEMNEGQSAHDVFVLIPYETLDRVTEVRDALAADETLQACDFFKATPRDPNYARMDTSLMRAFAGMPTLEVPRPPDEPRVFELRTYESHTQERAAKKVDMFNAGEIDVMKEVGLAPVFYGETLFAGDTPNLRYMMSGPDAETHAENFQGFLDHPTWDKLKKDPQYRQTVSKITKTFLRRARGSQI